MAPTNSKANTLTEGASGTPPPKKGLKCTEPGCNAVFSKNSKLATHLLKHTGERPFACDEPGCSKTYTNNSHLRRHKQVSHGEKQTEKILCNYKDCGQVFANRYNLKKHCNRAHNPELYPFKCSECSKAFHKKKQLQEHMYFHTGEPVFSCDQCDMSFTRQRLLNKHKRSHKTYTCECGEVFYRWSLMTSHRRICKKNEITCKVCHKTFKQMSNFKTHKLVHTDNSEKLVFVCPYEDCKRMYFYKKNLTFHINRFHKKTVRNKLYNCTYPKCQFVLKSKQNFKMHLQSHFKWRENKTRRPRHDKGKPKKSIVSILVGQPEIERREEKVIEGSIRIAEETESDPLLKQCDLALKVLLDKIVEAS